MKLQSHPNLIPDTHGDACPQGLQKLKGSDKCCCESKCCWNNCRLDPPPANCLDGLDAVWVNDTVKGYYVAQILTGNSIENCDLHLVTTSIK